MGVDLQGTDPTNETGQYFGRNWWGWRPIANYCLTQHADIAQKCVYWHSNDGDGLNAADSIELGNRLLADIESGRAAALADVDQITREALPKIECNICAGTGTRPDMVVANGCNGCQGKGKRDNMDSWYELHVENLQSFAGFLLACGGFEIY